MSAELSPRDINGRFRFYGPPFPLPGKCAVCGNVRTPVIDFGASVDGFGAILICQTCVEEAFNTLVKHDAVVVPQTVPAEVYEQQIFNLKEALDATVGNLRSLFDAGNVVLRNLADEVTLRSDEDDSGTDGEESARSEGTDEQTSDDAGNEGPPSVSGSRVRESIFDGI